MNRMPLFTAEASAYRSERLYVGYSGSEVGDTSSVVAAISDRNVCLAKCAADLAICTAGLKGPWYLMALYGIGCLIIAGICYRKCPPPAALPPTPTPTPPGGPALCGGYPIPPGYQCCRKDPRLGEYKRSSKAICCTKRAQGQILGKPKDTLQKSKFDQNLEKIKELLGYGLSVRKIARVLGYTSHIALNTYINK